MNGNHGSMTNMNQELTERDVFYSLSEDFSCVLLLDLEQNRVQLYRAAEGQKESIAALLQEQEDYRQWMLRCVLTHVEKNEQEQLIQSLLPEHLRAQLRAQGVVRLLCHGMQGRRRVAHRIKIARLDEAGNRAVVGLILGEESLEFRNAKKVQGGSIMIVADEELMPAMPVELLRGRYPLLLANSVRAAMKTLEEHSEEISVIFTRTGMPQCDGEELMRLVRADRRFQIIPVVLVTDEDSPETEVECLRIGAADHVARPFHAELVLTRIHRLRRLRDAIMMLNTLEIDQVTGLYTREFFNRYTAELLATNPDKEYHLLCIHVESLQMHMEKYGDAVGDLVIGYVAGMMRSRIPGATYCGRINSDTLAVLREYVPFTSRLELLKEVHDKAPVPNVSVKIGVVRLPVGAPERTLPVQRICEQAQQAISRIRQYYGVSIAEYDDSMRRELRREQQILSSMELALEQHQFQVYYQPKHSAESGKPCGVEALVRWAHPEYGFMEPGVFIPLFERIGFIRGLDRYVWRQVMADMVEWRSRGLPLLPVSINLSRRDFETGDLADWIIDLTDRMKIDHRLIHVELTESAFSEDPRKTAECIHRLHQAGFTIELDDFGIGYSSITTLNSMDVDILKIDRSIIQQDVPGSERNVLEFCMQLAEMMKLETVAEGVETEAQLMRVKSLGCGTVQGYYYAKPLPLPELEQYLLRYEPERTAANRN